MECGQWHPQLIHRLFTALDSINERLGGGAGFDLPPLSAEWQADCLRNTLREDDA